MPAKGWRKPISESFWAKVQKSDGCWEWTGGINWAGYGKHWSEGRCVVAHRYSYELNVGPIPDGLTIDHLCRNRKCVRPSHLEPVTIRENLSRSPLVPMNRTHCPKGHEYADGNIYYTNGRSGKERICRACSIAKSTRYISENRERVNAQIRFRRNAK